MPRILLFPCIAGAAVALFFPVFMALTVIMSEMAAAIIAAASMYLGIPIILLRLTAGRWEHTYRQTLDILIYLCLAGLVTWTGVTVLQWGAKEGRLWQLIFEAMFGWLYYRATGRGLFEPTKSIDADSERPDDSE